nr:hypothetical protein [Desulfobacula sp.]
MAKDSVKLIRAGADIKEALTDEEKSLFGACEQAIEADLKGFLAVGRALADIRDNRLYRETHKAFQKYCKDRWDISRAYADRQINSFETFALLEQKMTPIGVKNAPESSPGMNLGIDPIDLDDFADKYVASYDKRMAEAGSMCVSCGYRKAMIHKSKGVKIPGQHGKCTNPDGRCPEYKEAALKAAQGDMGDAGSEQHEIILPIKEAQARPLTKLKDPDDQVKAWGIVLGWLNDGKKLTASLINKAVKEVQGKGRETDIRDAAKEMKDTDRLTVQFKEHYKGLTSEINKERHNKWENMSARKAIEALEYLIVIIKKDFNR